MVVMLPAPQTVRPDDSIKLSALLEIFRYWRRRIPKIRIAYQKKVILRTEFTPKFVQMAKMSERLPNMALTGRKFGKFTPLRITVLTNTITNGRMGSLSEIQNFLPKRWRIYLKLSEIL